MYNRDDILRKVHMLMDAYRGGLLGGEKMPEHENPRLDIGSREIKPKAAAMPLPPLKSRVTGRQLAGWVCSAIEQIGDCLAACLAAQPHVQNGFDIVGPWAFYGASAHQHDNRLGIGFSNCLDHAHMPLGHFHVVTVKSF